MMWTKLLGWTIAVVIWLAIIIPAFLFLGYVLIGIFHSIAGLFIALLLLIIFGSGVYLTGERFLNKRIDN